MNFAFSEEQDQLREFVRSFLEDQYFSALSSSDSAYVDPTTGEPIAAERITELPSRDDALDYLRRRTYELQDTACCS